MTSEAGKQCNVHDLAIVNGLKTVVQTCVCGPGRTRRRAGVGLGEAAITEGPGPDNRSGRVVPAMC